MNAEVFSALSRNVGKLHEMKKDHEDMATEIAFLKLENSETRSKFHPFESFEFYFEFLFYYSFLSAFSTDALAEEKRDLADSGNVETLRTENLELYKENKQLKVDLEATQKLLADTQKAAKDQAEQDAESIRLLQGNLEARLAETEVIDDGLLSKQVSFYLFLA